MAAPPPIASLWISGPLSVLDRICLLSFVAQGHEVTLFHYFDLDNVPDGITLRDAREIYPRDEILTHKSGSPAMHADIFRLHLMKQTDMIWADTDQYCLRPFLPDADGYVLGRENDRLIVNSALRIPAEAPMLDYALEFVADEYPIPPWALPKRKRELKAAHEAGRPVHVSQMVFTTFGPFLLRHCLNKFNLMDHVSGADRFIPLPALQHRYAVKARFYDTIMQDMLTDNSDGVHLWGSNLRARGWLDRIEPGSFVGRAAKELGVAL